MAAYLSRNSDDTNDNDTVLLQPINELIVSPCLRTLQVLILLVQSESFSIYSSSILVRVIHNNEDNDDYNTGTSGTTSNNDNFDRDFWK